MENKICHEIKGIVRQIILLTRQSINLYPAESYSDWPLPPVHVYYVRLYAVGRPSSHIDVHRNNNGQFQKWKLDDSV